MLLQSTSHWIPAIERVTRQPWVPVPKMIKDSQFGHRGNPVFYEHEYWGFRNSRRLKRAHIVTLGDSQTYDGLGWKVLLGVA